jgi:hypothetical protein
MPTTRFTSFLLLLVLASSSARSEAPADPLAKYRERALSLEVGFFTGARVTRAGQDAHPGYFGDDAEVVFDGSPAALADMEQIGSSIGFGRHAQQDVGHEGSPNRPSRVLGRLRWRMAGVRTSAVSAVRGNF